MSKILNLLLFIGAFTLISCGEDICSCIEFAGEDNSKLKECIGDADEDELKSIIEDCAAAKVNDEAEVQGTENNHVLDESLDIEDQEGLKDPGEPSFEESH